MACAASINRTTALSCLQFCEPVDDQESGIKARQEKRMTGRIQGRCPTKLQLLPMGGHTLPQGALVHVPLSVTACGDTCRTLSALR